MAGNNCAIVWIMYFIICKYICLCAVTAFNAMHHDRRPTTQTVVIVKRYDRVQCDFVVIVMIRFPHCFLFWLWQAMLMCKQWFCGWYFINETIDNIAKTIRLYLYVIIDKAATKIAIDKITECEFCGSRNLFTKSNQLCSVETDEIKRKQKIRKLFAAIRYRWIDKTVPYMNFLSSHPSNGDKCSRSFWHK